MCIRDRCGPWRRYTGAGPRTEISRRERPHRSRPALWRPRRAAPFSLAPRTVPSVSCRSFMASRSLLACFALFANGACALMPRELNLTPVWFHRLDADGHMLEWDAAWPILHYERTPDGGDDFRIRPLYRRVTEPHLD